MADGTQRLHLRIGKGLAASVPMRYVIPIVGALVGASGWSLAVVGTDKAPVAMKAAWRDRVDEAVRVAQGIPNIDARLKHVEDQVEQLKQNAREDRAEMKELRRDVLMQALWSTPRDEATRVRWLEQRLREVERNQ